MVFKGSPWFFVFKSSRTASVKLKGVSIRSKVSVVRSLGHFLPKAFHCLSMSSSRQRLSKVPERSRRRSSNVAESNKNDA